MSNRRDLFIENTLISTYKNNNLLDDVYIEHNSLPELDFDDINTEVCFLGKKIDFPLIINAMTGGSERGCEINEILYAISKDLNIPMMVGSQMELLDNEELDQLYLGEEPEENRTRGLLLSNLSARCSPDNIRQVMDSIKADGVSIYLNSGQEIAAKDGNRSFKGILDNISKLTKVYAEKLIVKEVGFGMSKSTVKKLLDAGVKIVDISGSGGSNFMEIENLRSYEYDFSELYSWGIPSAKSIIDARSLSDDLTIIASGGIKTAMDVVRALIIGADYVAISGEILKFILHGGYDQTKKYLEELFYKVKVIMFLLGVKNIDELKKVDYILKGELKDLING